MLYSNHSAKLRKCLALGLLFLFLPAPQAAPPDMEKMLRLAEARYGAPAVVAVTQWRDAMATARGLTETEKINRINEFFNRRVVFVDDVEAWGKTDYWATPLESLGRGRGDCEDFAIAKYVSLRSLGVPLDRLRLTYVRAQIGGGSQAHMVLAYYPSPRAEPLILDNLVGDILPASRRGDLFPVFSFNSEGLWVGSGASEKASGSATARLSRWRDLIARMRAEGIEL
ncbi:transglutaminase [Betaproteobacteria bacterium SCN2]|jgi:predicted transglutaminase-like cysteine proteinase|nr:transglutaminase [Betaproteobacteria bacterium SCN2]